MIGQQQVTELVENYVRPDANISGHSSWARKISKISVAKLRMSGESDESSPGLGWEGKKAEQQVVSAQQTIAFLMGSPNVPPLMTETSNKSEFMSEISEAKQL